MEAIGRLAGGIAHDFNNMMTAVIGNCELLLRAGDLNDGQQPKVEDIREAGSKAASLTRQLPAYV
jgi:signal transduction histidine kinase